jgi:hypothetical protein
MSLRPLLERKAHYFKVKGLIQTPSRIFRLLHALANILPWAFHCHS